MSDPQEIAWETEQVGKPKGTRRKAPKRLSVERRAKRPPSLRGRGKRIAKDLKEVILADAKTEILAGKTIDQIAAKHGISHGTLELWLHALGDEYIQLRQAWIDGMLAEAGQMLRKEDTQLGLARARELQRRAQWYAERRDRDRYGDKPLQITVNTTNIDAGLVGSISDLIERKRDAIEAEVVDEQRSISENPSSEV